MNATLALARLRDDLGRVVGGAVGAVCVERLAAHVWVHGMHGSLSFVAQHRRGRACGAAVCDDRCAAMRSVAVEALREDVGGRARRLCAHDGDCVGRCGGVARADRCHARRAETPDGVVGTDRDVRRCGDREIRVWHGLRGRIGIGRGRVGVARCDARRACGTHGLRTMWTPHGGPDVSRDSECRHRVACGVGGGRATHACSDVDAFACDDRVCLDECAA
jgi:hypothetical protein